MLNAILIFPEGFISTGAWNLLVICLAFRIVTINSTNPLRICPIVFFFYSASRLWNSLPETCRCASSLGSFRAHLKTYLWTKSFPPYLFTISIFLAGSWPIFWPQTMALIIPIICAFRMRFLTQIKCYRSTTD